MSAISHHNVNFYEWKLGVLCSFCLRSWMSHHRYFDNFELSYNFNDALTSSEWESHNSSFIKDFLTLTKDKNLKR